jgi:hypothetical protein
MGNVALFTVIIADITTCDKRHPHAPITWSTRAGTQELEHGGELTQLAYDALRS